MSCCDECDVTEMLETLREDPVIAFGLEVAPVQTIRSVRGLSMRERRALTDAVMMPTSGSEDRRCACPGSRAGHASAPRSRCAEHEALAAMLTGVIELARGGHGPEARRTWEAFRGALRSHVANEEAKLARGTFDRQKGAIIRSQHSQLEAMLALISTRLDAHALEDLHRRLEEHTRYEEAIGFDCGCNGQAACGCTSNTSYPEQGGLAHITDPRMPIGPQTIMAGSIGELDPDGNVPPAIPPPPISPIPMGGPLLQKCFQHGPTRVIVKSGAQTIFDAMIPDIRQNRTWHWGLFELADLGVTNFPLAGGDPLSIKVDSPGECDFRTPIEVQLFARDPELVPAELFQRFKSWVGSVKTGPGVGKDDWQVQADPSPLSGLLWELTPGWPPRVNLPDVVSVMYPGIKFTRLELPTPQPVSELLPSTIPTKKNPQTALQPAMFTHGLEFGVRAGWPSAEGGIKAIRIVQHVGSGGCASHFDYNDLITPLVAQMSQEIRSICDRGVRFARLADAVIVPTLRHVTGTPGVLPDAADSRGGFFVYVHVEVEQGDMFGGCSIVAAQEYEFALDGRGMLRLMPVGPLGLAEQSHGGVFGNACDDHSLNLPFTLLAPIREQAGLRTTIRGLLTNAGYDFETRSIPGNVMQISDYLQWFPSWGTPHPAGVPDTWCLPGETQPDDVYGFQTALCCRNGTCRLPAIAGLPAVRCADGADPCANFKNLFLLPALDDPLRTRLDPWTGADLGVRGSPERKALIGAIEKAPTRCISVSMDLGGARSAQCQIGIPIKRLALHPDEIVAVLWEHAADFDSVARAVDVVSQDPFFGLTPGIVSRLSCQPARNPSLGIRPGLDDPGDPWAWLEGLSQPVFAPGSFERPRPSAGDIEQWGLHEAIWRQELFNSWSGWDNRRFPAIILRDDQDPTLGCLSRQHCLARVNAWWGDREYVNPVGQPDPLEQMRARCCDGTWLSFHKCFPELRYG